MAVGVQGSRVRGFEAVLEVGTTDQGQVVEAGGGIGLPEDVELHMRVPAVVIVVRDSRLRAWRIQFGGMVVEPGKTICYDPGGGGCFADRKQPGDGNEADVGGYTPEGKSGYAPNGTEVLDVIDVRNREVGGAD